MECLDVEIDAILFKGPLQEPVMALRYTTIPEMDLEVGTPRQICALP